jgi:hypothetical protein
VELVQLEPPLDGRLALELQAEFAEEGDRGLEVVDDEKDVVHSQQFVFRHG